MYVPSCNLGHMLSVAILKIGKKGGIGGGGRVSAQGAVHIAALAGCRKALVSTSLAISLLLDTNGRR